MKTCDFCKYRIGPGDMFDCSGSRHKYILKGKDFHKMCGNITESYLDYAKEDLSEEENLAFSAYDVAEWVYEIFCDDCEHLLTEEGQECRLGILDCRIIRREFSDDN